MKLPIHQKYLDAIKDGSKTIEWREAHLTLESIETGEQILVKVNNSGVLPWGSCPEDIQGIMKEDYVLMMTLKPGYEMVRPKDPVVCGKCGVDQSDTLSTRGWELVMEDGDVMCTLHPCDGILRRRD